MSIVCGSLHRVERRVFGDLVQLDALGILELEQLRQMPGDGFAFAIGVGREEDFGRGFQRALELLDDVALPFDRQVARGEVVLDVDAERALG